MENLNTDIITSCIVKKLEIVDRYSFSLTCKFIYNCVDYRDDYVYYPSDREYLKK